MKNGKMVVVAVACSVLAACSPSPQEGATPSPTQEPVPSSTAAHRPITKPDELQLENAAFKRSRLRVDQAIADLKKVGLWRKLTKHLYAVKFGSRTGMESVPEDGHLADAYLTAKIDGTEGGAYCDVMFFPTAILLDLERWGNYHAQGLLPEAPPSVRQFWASIMGHELAHCLPGRNGERVAGVWEERVLKAVQAARLE